MMDPGTGQRCVVRALSSAAQYTLGTLRLNNRKSLRDFWRELDRRHLQLQQRLAKLDELLRQLILEMENRGESLELLNICDDFVSQRTQCLQALQTVRDLCPFPAQ